MRSIEEYISGFTDGEGSFMICFSPRSKMLVGWEVRPSFSASQNGDRAEVLYLMQEYFGCGTIRPNRKDRTLKYEVRSLNDLLMKVIPHFNKYPLLSSKKKGFEIFADVCERMRGGAHLTLHGLKKITRLVQQMEFSHSRKYHFNEIGAVEMKI